MSEEGKKVLKEKEIPLPPTKEALITTVQRVLGLAGVVFLQITPSALSIKRWVRTEDEEVLPAPVHKDEELVTPTRAILETVEMREQVFDPALHPYLALERAMRTATNAGLQPRWLVADPGPVFPALFGLEEVGEYFMGMHVLPHNDGVYDEKKVVVIASPTTYLTDAKLGIVVDIGG